MARFVYLASLAFAVASAGVAPVAAETPVSGDVSGTWSSGTYHATGDIWVQDGTSLNVHSGVVVKFADGVELHVRGTLSAASAIFTSEDDDSVGETLAASDGVPTAGDWDGIYVNGAFTGMADFSGCEVRFGGGTGNANANVHFYYAESGSGFSGGASRDSAQNGITVIGCSPDIDGVSIADNAGHGLSASVVQSAPTVTNCDFDSNGGWAAHLGGVGLTSYSGNTGAGNGTNGIGLFGTVTGTVTWTMGTNFPFVMDGVVTVSNGSTLILPAGTVVKASASGEMTVAGTLDVNGTSGSPVVFTSLKDDTAGGNTDGDRATPAPGDWKGLYVQGGSGNDATGLFDDCEIRYGGASGNANADLHFYYADPSSYFSSSLASRSYFVGVRITACSPSITDSEMSSNVGEGLLATTSGAPVVTGCQFNNNGGFGAVLSGVTLTAFSGNSGSSNGTNGMGLSGTVSSDVSWSMGASSFPFVLTGQVVVNNGTTLTLPAGTVVKADSTGSMEVRGTLDANGEIGSEVVFTSLADDQFAGDTNGDGPSTGMPGDWGGIYLNGGSGAGIGHLDHTIVSYGGKAGNADSNVFFYYSDPGSTFTSSVASHSAQQGARVWAASPLVQDSTFSDNALDGLWVTATTARPTITGCTFDDNGSRGAILSNISLSSYSGNQGSGNGLDGFVLWGTVGADATWSMGSPTFPFVLQGTVTVSNGATLTLPAGTVVKASSSGAVTVNGTLDVNGAEDNEVVFTADEDDEYGGDTNGDGPSVGGPGAWPGIYVTGGGGTGIASFRHAILRFGGAAGNANANVYLYYSGAGSEFVDSTSESSSQVGVRVASGAPTLSDSVFSDNASHGLYVSVATAAPIVTGCTFDDNGGYGAHLDTVTLTGFSGNQGTGNTTNGLAVSGTVASSQTWSMGSPTFPFVLPGTVTVNDGTTLTLSQGTILKAGAAGEVVVNGTLAAEGTSTGEVVLTSLRDDTFGGDTDGAGGDPAPGDWKGVYLSGGAGVAVGRFHHARLRYAGAAGNASANLHFYYSNPGSYFVRSVSELSAQRGVTISGCSPKVRGSTIVNNDDYGVYLVASAQPDLGQQETARDWGCNLIDGNDGGVWEVYNSSPLDIDAYQNFWGYGTAGEIDAVVYDDDEGAVGEVLFEPWLPDGALFHDPFESGDTSAWTSVATKLAGARSDLR